jgi:hypothetical protein
VTPPGGLKSRTRRPASVEGVRPVFGIDCAGSRFCTPRSDEDKAAARAHWALVYGERARERNAAARAQLLALRRRRGEFGEVG